MSSVEQALLKLTKNPELKRVHDEQADIVSIARAIRRMRKSAGLTQTELAERMHTSQSQIARLESFDNRSKPNLETLQAIAHACGLRLLVGAAPAEVAENQENLIAL